MLDSESGFVVSVMKMAIDNANQNGCHPDPELAKGKWKDLLCIFIASAEPVSSPTAVVLVTPGPAMH
jgi:hypothetical protein